MREEKDGVSGENKPTSIKRHLSLVMSLFQTILAVRVPPPKELLVRLLFL